MTTEERIKKKKREKLKKDLIEILIVLAVIAILGFGFHLFILKMTMARFPWIY